MKKEFKNCGSNSSSSSCIYFMGLIGAAVYYISAASGFWMGVLGFMKALAWPAFLVYEAFMHLGV